MHNFLRAIGFSGLKTRDDLEKVLNKVVEESKNSSYVALDDSTCITEYSLDFAPRMGICVCGETDDNDKFIRDYYYPYFRGNKVSTKEKSVFERHAAQFSFAGVCDDNKIGISIIYYLLNHTRHIMETYKNETLPVGTTLSLSGLSITGTIMMPIAKSVRQKASADVGKSKRNKLMEMARNGDEEAIESLTLEDLDIYSSLLRKVKKTDVYSLVDTYFMPCGVECDQYSILGEITELEEAVNALSGETVYQMSLNCNEIPMDICINKADLYGEPAVGRRFKGNVWLQGVLNYPE